MKHKTHSPDTENTQAPLPSPSQPDFFAHNDTLPAPSKHSSYVRRKLRLTWPFYVSIISATVICGSILVALLMRDQMSALLSNTVLAPFVAQSETELTDARGAEIAGPSSSSGTSTQSYPTESELTAAPKAETVPGGSTTGPGENITDIPTKPPINPDPEPSPKPTKSTTKVYTGATDHKGITHYESLAKKKASIVNNFISWGAEGASNMRPFPAEYVTKVRDHGSIPMISWNPYYRNSNGELVGYSLKDIISGKHDAYLKKWAADAKAWGKPMFLRTMHEANGGWYHWSARLNGNQQYIQAWRHIHDIFTKQGVTNVTWVWCVSSKLDLNNPTELTGFYPGDAYVDWVAVDGYNRNTWRTFVQVFKPSYDDLTKLTTKPIMIAENAVEPSSNGYSRADWFTNALKTHMPSSFPRIKAYLYFNVDNTKAGPGETPVLQSLSNSDGAADAFAAAIGIDYYATNTFGGLTGGKIKPL